VKTSPLILRALASLLVAAGLLWALVTWGGVEVADIEQTLEELTFSQWLMALGVHAGIYLLRAWRFSTLTPAESRPSFGRVLAASSAHNLAAYVLPLKSGEATFVLYSSGVGGVPVRASAASLLVSRLLDLFVLCGCMFVVMWLAPILAHGGMPEEVMEGSALDIAERFETMMILGAVFFVVGLLAGLACMYRAGFVSLIAGALRLVRVERTALGRKLISTIGRFSDALDEAGAHRGVLRATALSVALWAGVIAFYSVLLTAFGWPEGQEVLVPAVLASGLASLANTLPVNGFAGFGTQEGGWVLGMSLWGVDPELALSVGVSAHLVQLGNLILFGMLGHLGMAILPNSKAREA
jgi:uncharacterized protein (TIRG00374 family)